MAEKFRLTREDFLTIAKASALDTADPQHMEELYSFLQSVLPGLKKIERLDLTGFEPFMPSILSQGDER